MAVAKREGSRRTLIIEQQPIPENSRRFSERTDLPVPKKGKRERVSKRTVKKEEWLSVILRN